MRSITRGALGCALMMAVAGAAHAGVDTVTAQLEHTDYSDGYGRRDVAGVEITGRAAGSRWQLGVAHGERDYGGVAYRGVRLHGGLVHDWTPRLSTRTAVTLSDRDPVFVNRQIAQDINIKPAANTVLTVGGRYAEYYGGSYVTAWSVGAAYYFPRLSVAYRYSRHRLSTGTGGGGSTVSLRLKDAQGKGSTQLWLGTGNSAYTAELDPTLLREHRAKRVFLRRNQPLGEHLMLHAGLGKAWHSTRVDRFSSIESQLGLGYHW